MQTIDMKTRGWERIFYAGHVGALFASIPRGIVGGVFCVILASTTALGLSSLRYTEMGSSRNLLIVGLALFLGLSVPHYMVAYTATMGHRPINTPSEGVSWETWEFSLLTFVFIQ